MRLKEDLNYTRMSKMEDMIAYCGYNTAFELIRDNLTEDDLLDLLEQFVHEDKTGLVYDICQDIANDKYEWVDLEQIKADAEDAAYQEFKDRRLCDE